MLKLVLAFLMGMGVGSIILLICFFLWMIFRKHLSRRLLTVAILVDQDLWQTDSAIAVTSYIGDIISWISEVFRQEFNITFTVNHLEPREFEAFDGEMDTAKFYDDIKFIPPKIQSDIIAGFTHKRLAVCKYSKALNGRVKQKNVLGEANRTINAAIIQLFGEYDVKLTTNIAIHEFAHLFLATHVNCKHSIMYKTTLRNAPPIYFDLMNKVAILMNKYKEFSR